MTVKISINDNHKTLIIDSIAEAIGVDISNYRQENDLFTYNGIHFTKWDFINTNIVNALPPNFQTYKIERGNLWSFLLVHDEQSGNVYIFMAEKRFNELTKSRSLEKRQVNMKPHFLDALALLNEQLLVQQGQESFFEVELPEWNELCQRTLNKMTNFLVGGVNNLVVITHSASRGELKRVEAYVLTMQLEIFHMEDWTQYISPNFANVLQTLEVTDLSKEEEEEIIVTLKEVHQQENSIVKLRKDEKETEE